eukprot:7552764-Pyramimonas_sp.AAC.1
MARRASAAAGRRVRRSRLRQRASVQGNEDPFGRTRPASTTEHILPPLPRLVPGACVRFAHG